MESAIVCNCFCVQQAQAVYAHNRSRRCRGLKQRTASCGAMSVTPYSDSEEVWKSLCFFAWRPSEIFRCWDTDWIWIWICWMFGFCISEHLFCIYTAQPIEECGARRISAKCFRERSYCFKLYSSYTMWRTCEGKLTDYNANITLSHVCGRFTS